MRNYLIIAAMFAAFGAAAQPTLAGTDKIGVSRSTAVWQISVDDLATYFAAGSGTVSSVSVVSANGFAGTVATATSTPAITLTTTITGILSGNGTAISAATTTGTGSTVVLNNGPTLVAPILGTPASGTLTNATGLPISTGVSGLGTGVATFLATPSSANLIAAVTDETGTGALVFGTSPTLTTPNLGTPSAATLTNATGLPIATGVSGLGTGVATFLATPSTANLAAAVTGETGTGALVFATSPTLVTPALGTPASGVMTNVTGLPLTTGVTGILPIANGGLNLSALGGDNTFLASNGSSYYAATAAFTFNDAAFSVARTGGTVNFNVPNATAALGGIMSTTTQTVAGAKTFTGLFTGSAGIVGTATASQAGIHVNGAEKQAFRSVTATSTVAETDRRVYIGTLTADITLNLPACNSTRDGWVWSFTKTGSDTFAAILDPNSTETIDGQTTKSIYSQYTTFACQCVNGTGYISVSSGK